MKKYLTLWLISGILWIPSAGYGQTTNTEQEINTLISKMTLEQKLDFIGGVNGFDIRTIPSLGIPMIHMSDGPAGVRNYGPSTAYPAPVTLAASWDTTLAARVGSSIGREARSKDVHIMLGPAMNICRAPMCGRNFEYLGEDPFLAGKIASNYIRGMQKEGVMACAKHFDANYQEYNRHNGSSDMDERTLREIYLPAFKACVQEGNVATIMTSYNLVNGVHMSQNNHLLNDILKKEWGFKGFVMSDWTSTYNGVACANGGLDLEMPNAVHMCRDTLLPAIKAGKVSEKTIDDKIRRILREYARFDLFDHPDLSKDFVLDSAYVRNTAIQEAREGIVLLKNADHILPVDKARVKNIAIIGPNAYPAVTGGGGSSFVRPLHEISLLDAVKQIAGNAVKIQFDPGVYHEASLPDAFYQKADFYTLVNGKKVKGMQMGVYSNRWPEGKPDYEKVVPDVNQVFADSLPGISRTRFAVKFSGLLKVARTGMYQFVVSSDAGYRLMIDGKQVLGAWNSQGERLRSTGVHLDANKEYKVELGYLQRSLKGVIRLGYQTPEEYALKSAVALRKAVELASHSDLVLLNVGFNSETEHEGDDRTFGLPQEQEKLVRAITGANKNVVVIINSGGNVDMQGWIAKTPGLIQAWYPGGEGNKALAEILFGITNPSGKLPDSFEKRWQDNADYNSYYDTDGDNHVKFTEGIFTGYRHFDKDHIAPQFPFGFGLSYTTFGYSNLAVNKSQFNPSDGLAVKCMVKNTGKRDGAEVVELYVGEQNPVLPRPVKELKSFARVWLKAGESKTVTFHLSRDAFHYYNPGKHAWVVDNNHVFNILVGSSSEDIRLKKTVTVKD